MENFPPYTKDASHYHDCAVRQKHQDRVSTSQNRLGTTLSRELLELCACITLSPELRCVMDLILFLLTFIYRVCVGDLETDGTTVHKKTVEGYLNVVANILFGMGC